MVVRQILHPSIYALDPLEQHEHLVPAHSPVSVRVALHRRLRHLLIARGWSHSHHQRQIAIGVEELIAFQLSRMVGIVPEEDLVDVVYKHLIVYPRVPSSTIVDIDEAAHVHVVLVVAPSVETSVTMAVPVAVMVVMALMPSETACVSTYLPCPHIK